MDASGVMALAVFGNRQGTGTHRRRAGRSSLSSFLLPPSSFSLHPFPKALGRQGFVFCHRFTPTRLHARLSLPLELVKVLCQVN
jgi:hypothetical protein